MNWKKKCDRCLLSKKEHKEPYPTWWQWANIKVHNWEEPSKPPTKGSVHMAPMWNAHLVRINSLSSRMMRLPLCFEEYEPGQNFGYNPDDDPFSVTCKKCIRWYLDGTSAKIEGDKKRARIQKRKQKEERLRRKGKAGSKSKASRKAGKKLRSGGEREVRLHRRKSKRHSSD